MKAPKAALASNLGEASLQRQLIQTPSSLSLPTFPATEPSFLNEVVALTDFFKADNSWHADDMLGTMNEQAAQQEDIASPALSAPAEGHAQG